MNYNYYIPMCTLLGVMFFCYIHGCIKYTSTPTCISARHGCTCILLVEREKSAHHIHSIERSIDRLVPVISVRLIHFLVYIVIVLIIIHKTIRFVIRWMFYVAASASRAP